jgi:hypothetical protein
LSRPARRRVITGSSPSARTIAASSVSTSAGSRAW